MQYTSLWGKASCRYIMIILPEFNCKLIPSGNFNLLASSTIWGMGDLAYCWVLVATCLNLIFLLLVTIPCSLSALQNHLLNFLLLIQDLVNFSNNFFLCSDWVFIFASWSAQVYDLNLAPYIRYKPVFCTDSILLLSAFGIMVVQAGTANCRILRTWHRSTFSKSASQAPRDLSRRMIHIRFQARPKTYLVLAFVLRSELIWYPTSFMLSTTSSLASSDKHSSGMKS